MRTTKAEINQIIKEEEDKLLNEALPPKIRIPKITPRPIIRPRPMPKPAKLAPGTGLPIIKPSGRPILKPQDIPQFKPKPIATPETPSLNILDPTQFAHGGHQAVHKAMDPDDPTFDEPLPPNLEVVQVDPATNKPYRWIDPETGRHEMDRHAELDELLDTYIRTHFPPTDRPRSPLSDDDINHFKNWRAKQQEARMKRWENDPRHKGNSQQRYMVHKLKEHLKESYIDGGHKKAWISAGVPEAVYNDTVLPRIMNNLNSLPVYFSPYAPPMEVGLANWEDTPGMFYTPRNSIYMNTWDNQRNTFVRSRPQQSTLTHEVGHRISHDPMLAAILNKYKKKYTPTEMHRASDILALNWGADPQIGSRVLQHGKPDPYEYHPASVYEPYTLKTGAVKDQVSQQTSLASMQPVELMSLLNLQLSGPTPATISGEGFKWFMVGNKAMMHGIGSLSERDRNIAGAQMTWRTKIEEIYADVQAVKAQLGRPMTEADIIDTCLGMDTEGSRAINRRPTFRDFLDCRDAKKTANTFNKIVKVEPRQAPTSMVAEHKLNQLIKEEYNKLIKEIQLLANR